MKAVRSAGVLGWVTCAALLINALSPAVVCVGLFDGPMWICSCHGQRIGSHPTTAGTSVTPSEKVSISLAEVLGLDPRELFFLANPETKDLVSQKLTSSKASAWDVFSADQKLRKVHGITGSEMETLSQIALMGEVRSSRDFIFILNTIRHTLGRQ